MQNTLIISMIYTNNILVTGCKGQLGSEIKELANNYENFNFIYRY